MCRKKKICTELGTNPQLWDTHAPLPPPAWFLKELKLFKQAVTKASIGDVPTSIQLLKQIKSDELRTWYVEHGQVSGNARNRILAIPKPQAITKELDKVQSPDKYAKAVFERDYYSCRYCGMHVIPKKILALYRKIVGRQLFTDTGNNDERHGIVLAFRANVDHVIPYKLGGRTSLNNLVTSCWSCNYGKAGYTLEQLGLNDPRNQQPKYTSWDGLTSLETKLKKYRT